MAKKLLLLLSGVLLVQFSSCMPTTTADSDSEKDSKTRHTELFNFFSSEMQELIKSRFETYQHLHRDLNAAGISEISQVFKDLMLQIKDRIEQAAKINSIDDEYIKYVIGDYFLYDLDLIFTNMLEKLEQEEDLPKELIEIIENAMTGIWILAEERISSVASVVNTLITMRSNKESDIKSVSKVDGSN